MTKAHTDTTVRALLVLACSRFDAGIKLTNLVEKMPSHRHATQFCRSKEPLSLLSNTITFFVEVNGLGYMSEHV